MFKSALFCLLVAICFSVSVPCVQIQSSKNGNATDCSISRVDDRTISWGSKINFNVAYEWKTDSIYNLLADPGSPRLPVNWEKS